MPKVLSHAAAPGECGSRPAGQHRGGQTTARGELTADDAPLGTSGFYNVAQHLIHGVLIKNSQIAVGQQVHLESLELQTLFGGHVANSDGSEIRQAGFGADGRILRKTCGDNVARKLIWPSFKARQTGRDTPARV